MSEYPCCARSSFRRNLTIHRSLCHLSQVVTASRDRLGRPNCRKLMDKVNVPPYVLLVASKSGAERSIWAIIN